MTPEHKALVEAEASFEKIRTTLVNHLNEPERSAFWEAVDARDKIRESLSAQCAQPQAGEPVAFLVERLAGPGYGSPRTVIDAAKYDPRRDDFWCGDAKTRHLITPLYASPQPANQAQVTDAIRGIVEDALNSAIPEPWEVAEHATQRILAAISAGGQALAASGEPSR